MTNNSFSGEEIVDAVYDTALSPKKFDDLLNAWDKVFTDASIDDAQAMLGEHKHSLVKHFSRADQIFLSTQVASTHMPQQIVDNEPTSAFISDNKGQIIAANASAIDNLNIVEKMNVNALPLDAKAEVQLTSIFKSATFGGANNTSMAIRGTNLLTGQVYVLVAQRLFDLKTNAEKPAMFLFKSSVATWHSGIEILLASAFELTATEIHILAGINQGLSLKEIAQQRKRSLDTIRTQMKSILQKTEAQNQTNLMRHITSLLLVVNSIDDKKLALNSHEESTCPELQSIETLTSKTIRFRDYQGQSELAYLPVLCFFPVLGSILSSEIQASYAQAGIRLIILEEAEDTPSSYKSKPEYFEQLMQAYLAIIDYLKLPKVSLLGHCAGGVYAIEFAKRFSERCTAVFCVDTGAPLRTKEQWNAVSATAKRTFMVAKSFPSVLFMPHRLVAQRFFSGDKGQQKTVEYFYNDCKNDLAILANDTAVKRWSLDMLTFCFNDIKRPIRACEIWVQDWSGALAEVSKTTPVCFIHGDNNPQFRLCDIVEMTQMHENIFLRVAKGAQQLTFVTHLELIQASLVKPTSFLT